MWTYAIGSVLAGLVSGYLAMYTQSTALMVAAYGVAVTVGAFLCVQNTAAGAARVAMRYAVVGIIAAVLLFAGFARGGGWGALVAYYFALLIAAATPVAAAVGAFAAHSGGGVGTASTGEAV